MGTVDQQVGTVDQQVETADQQVGTADQQVGTVDQQVGTADQQVGTVDQQVGTVDQQVGTVDQQVGTADQQCRQLITEVFKDLATEFVEWKSHDSSSLTNQHLVVTSCHACELSTVDRLADSVISTRKRL